MDDSPISNEALEAEAERVAKALRIVLKRAPAEVRKRVRALLAEVFRVVGDEEIAVRARVRLARALEEALAELTARETFVPQYYGGGRLGLIRAWDPVRIRETIDRRRVAAHFRRYQQRVDRAHERLRWFYERVGLEVEPRPEPKPWELPYAALEESHELLWGRIKGSDLG